MSSSYSASAVGLVHTFQILLLLIKVLNLLIWKRKKIWSLTFCCGNVNRIRCSASFISLDWRSVTQLSVLQDCSQWMTKSPTLNTLNNKKHISGWGPFGCMWRQVFWKVIWMIKSKAGGSDVWRTVAFQLQWLKGVITI